MKKRRKDFKVARTKIFRALSDPIRLEILQYLRDGEKCVSDLLPLLKVVQPLVSRHLKILRNCGIVSFRKEGNRKPYWVTDKRIFEIIDMVGEDLVNSLSKYAEEKLL
ncbi:MAG: ArsR/SmtB family transcription factor [Thermoproteota archaeon]